ncbi:MAG: bifunctional phosphoribosylaminoimidazolecarboxamide formyltransferase/IMP cyclohydrolase [Bacteroidota bacterium]|nr:bifunctional phosphoribosylaminoimidazolecarboxamide formyltransferase/IMP cyclohydrolase [Bacteroidota bacterium]
MKDRIKISSALISVFDKNGLEPVLKKLNKLGVSFYSTGGTESFIKDLGFPVTSVESITEYPSILGGRVKTLHPKIFGGILNRKEEATDQSTIKKLGIPQIDLVIVDLYPFEETVFSGATEKEVIEKIDIGGIALIRAAAKNFKDVFCVSSKKDYSEFLSMLEENNAETSIDDRKKFSIKAFKTSSNYDSIILNYFQKNQKSNKKNLNKTLKLRYGENPHQKGEFIGPIDKIIDKISGKDLSYNNLLDIDAAVNLMSEFNNQTCSFGIFKHTNACGFATRSNTKKAYLDSLAGDPISAFGGILISNTEIDSETANEINSLFFEILIAPSFSDEAKEKLLEKKKNRALIILKRNYSLPEKIFRTCLNGSLEQTRDNLTDSIGNLTYVTNLKPSKNQIEDLLFGSKISKHTKSNTIVLVKNKQLLGSGTGQTSRVDALKQAIEKSRKFEFNLKNAVLISDAFFPFPDCVEIAEKEGINSILQPGGSINDNLSIDYCNKNNLSMVFTGIRHFKH